jgi:hypothetical protein
MSRIDKIFKDKLSNKGLAYSDAHWQQMENLLDQQKKTGWFTMPKLALILLLLAGSSAVGLWLYDSNQAPQTTVNQMITKNLPIQSNIPQNEDVVESHSSIKGNEIAKTVTLTPILPLQFNSLTTAEENVPNLPKEEILIPQVDTSIPFSWETIALTSSNALRFDYATSFPTYTQIAPLFPPKKWSLYVGIYANTVNYQKELSTSLATLTASQMPMESQNMGVQVRLKRNNWSFGTGIGFTQLNEQTNFETSETTWIYTTGYRLIEDQYTETPRGKKVSLIKKEIDSVGTTTTQIDCPNCQTQFNYVNIPLHVQYQLSKNRISAFGQMGLNMAVLQKASGLYGVSISEEKDELIVLPLANNASYLNPILWQTQAELGAKYAISSQWNIWGSYSLNKSMTSMMKEYAQIPILHQVGFGLEYKIR